MSVAGLVVPLVASLLLSVMTWAMWSWRRPAERSEADRLAFRISAVWYVMLSIFPAALAFFWLSLNGRAAGLPELAILPLQIGVWLGGANA